MTDSSTSNSHTATAEAKEGHRIKSISFLSSLRHILLQNKNGPCPLLAAANALLLRGAISLPGRCISAGQVSIDDVVNILAERAVAAVAAAAVAADAATAPSQESATIADEENSSSLASAAPAPAPSSPSNQDSPRASAALHAQHHLHEVLSLFPSLQYGMDVNPKFTSGPTGVEFTSNLTCFDLLGVELVHGWLLDPQDVETASVVGDKTYNELVEVVIRGNEAGDEVDKLGKLIDAKAAGVEIAVPLVMSDAEQEGKNDDDGNNDDKGESSASASEPPEEKGEEPKKPAAVEQDQQQKQRSKPLSEFSLDELRQMHREESDIAHVGHLVNSFLTSTSHQLTYHGLHELHNHLSDNSLCVFFRNNHFATLAKQDGHLWLLVTDLGYANVPEVVWEKLDAVDGSTTLYDEYFSIPEPRKSMGASAVPTLSSGEVAGQGGQVDADHQFALQLSKHSDGQGGGSGAAPLATTAGGGQAEKEGRLMAAATEASIRDWHSAKENGQGNVDAGVVAVGIPSAPPAGISNDTTPAANQNGQDGSIPLTPPASSVAPLDQGSFVPSDEAIARQLQAQMNSDQESLALARRLQAEEDAAARRRRQQQQQQQQQQGATAPSAGRSSGAADKSNCVIS